MTVGFGLDSIAQVVEEEQSRSITAENPKGKVGAGGQAASNLGPGRKGRPAIENIAPGETVTLAKIDGPGVIRHLWFTVFDESEVSEYVFRDLVLRMYWDGEDKPSVEVPFGDFFCNGAAERCEIDSMPIVCVPDIGFNCYFPMPFGKHAKVTIESNHPTDIAPFFYQIDYSLVPDLPDDTGYFHAQWRRENPTTKGEDFTIVNSIEGAGQYVGTYLAWTALSEYWYGEGEVKFYIDGDEEYPTICGTGTEDYVGGAWGYDDSGYGTPKTYSTSFMGYPFHDTSDGSDGHGRPPTHGMYRWHIPDPIRFTEDLCVEVQQIGDHPKTHNYFERSDDISAVSYWYQKEPHNSFPEFPDREERVPR
jgi:hypothetical protein